jgi:hypothetical protein
MHIAEATEQLAKLLRDYYEERDSEDTAISFLAQIALIREFRDRGDLDAWESAVLGVFTDAEWAEFERRPDWRMLDYAWEVGRSNMYGAIDEERTRKLYREACEHVSFITGRQPLSATSIDFSAW